MTEFGFIDSIKTLFAPLPDNGFEGIGDDCSVLSVGGGESLVFTADLLTEGVHFLRTATSPRELGRKSLAVNLSDVAAMGARPVATLLSIALPADAADAWAAEFMLGYRELSEEFGVTLAGGDTTRSAAGITINVKAIGRIAVVTDGAHALGSVRHGKRAGQVADLTTFSFHAVKNFTTAEGGAVTWREGLFDADELYHDFMLMSLHGQSKDALAKTKAGAWEYDVAFPGWKCNMTDLQAGLGLAQLRRYPGMLARRRQMVARYMRNLADLDVSILQHYRAADGSDACDADDAAARADASQESSSGHLMLVRLNGCGRQLRDRVIELMAEDGVATNVHYKPLPLLTAYRNLGFDIADFPNALAQFENEITLPLHTKLSDDDIDEVCRCLRQAISQAKAEGAR